MSEPELWMPIAGFEGMYSVSTLGRVRSEPRVVMRGNGRKYTVRGRLLSPARKRSGHLSVQLHEIGQGVQRLHVHRLVLLAFTGEPPTPLHDAAHNDGDPGNNRLGNLRWATRPENCADKLKHGTHNRGERHPLSKLSDDEVRSIRLSELSPKDIASRFGISRGHAWALKTCARRSHP